MVKRSAHAARRWRRRVATGLLAVLILMSGSLGAVGWIASNRLMHPGFVAYAWHLQDYPELRPQAVTIMSQTHTRLAGRFFPGRLRATIVLSAGFGDTQDGMLPWVRFLHRAGYSVFTYDMRGKGQSGGAGVTMGALEQYDLISVVDYLVTRPDVDRARIGALGVSLGGATSILAAAQDQRIKAVVDDCGFSDVSSLIATDFERFIHLPSFPFAPVAALVAQWRTGVNVAAVSPLARIASISPRPIFIIHGTADADVAPQNSQRLFEAARTPKQLWMVRGAGHDESLAVGGAEYERRVVAFFHAALGT